MITWSWWLLSLVFLIFNSSSLSMTLSRNPRLVLMIPASFSYSLPRVYDRCLLFSLRCNFTTLYPGPPSGHTNLSYNIPRKSASVAAEGYKSKQYIIRFSIIALKKWWMAFGKDRDTRPVGVSLCVICSCNGVISVTASATMMVISLIWGSSEIFNSIAVSRN